MKSKIKYNIIENSKSEGIFVIEGEKTLLIDSNEITLNSIGIVLYDSQGIVRNNSVVENNVCGILTELSTTAVIMNNTIAKNQTTGIIIKDPSLPDLKNNSIEKNKIFQV